MGTFLINPEFPASFRSFKETNRISGRKTLLPPAGDLRLADLNTRGLTAADCDWADLVMLTGMITNAIIYWLWSGRPNNGGKP